MFSFDLKNLLQGISNLKQGTQLEQKLIDIKFPLDDYLNDNEAIQCYKDMKNNAKRFFDKQKIKLLIKYITEEPKKENYLKGHKCPYVASEMLKSDCEYVQDLFVLSNKEYNEKYKIEQKDVKSIDKGKYINLVPAPILNYNYNLKNDNNNNENKDNNDKNIEKKDIINEKEEVNKNIINQKDNSNNNIENKNDTNNNDKNKDDKNNNQENINNVKEENINQTIEENKIEKDNNKTIEPNNNKVVVEENTPKCNNTKKDKKEEEK